MKIAVCDCLLPKFKESNSFKREQRIWMLSSFVLRVSISRTKNCYCKQMVADEIYSPCQDKEHTINREWAKF